MEAESQVGLSVALINFDSVINHINDNTIVGNVVDLSIASTSLQISAEGGGGVGPDLDASAILIPLVHVRNCKDFCDLQWCYGMRC